MINQEELRARQKKVGIYAFVVGFFIALFILVIFIMNNNTVKPPEVYEFDAVSAGVPLKYDFATQLISLLDSQATTTATSTVSSKGSKGPAYTFYLNSETGSLPAGLKLDADGVLRGTPTEEGDNEFEVCIKDTGGNSACRIYTMPVGPKTTTKTTSNTNSTGGSGQNKNIVQGTTRTEKWEGTYTNRGVFDNTCTTDTVGPVSICMTWQGKNFTGITNYPGGLKDTYTNNPNDVCSYMPSCFGQPGQLSHCGGDQNMTGYIDANGNLKFTFLQFPAGWFIAWDPKNPNLPGGQNSAVMTGNSMTIEFSTVVSVTTHVDATSKGSLTATKVSDSCK